MRNAFMDVMTHAKFHFNRLMLTLMFGIRASEPPPQAWRTTEKVGPDRVKTTNDPRSYDPNSANKPPATSTGLDDRKERNRTHINHKIHTSFCCIYLPTYPYDPRSLKSKLPIQINSWTRKNTN